MGIGRQWEIGIGKAAHSDSTYSRIAVAFPINIAAAFRAEMKANAITAVAVPLINLALAFEPDPIFQRVSHGLAGSTRLGRSKPSLLGCVIPPQTLEDASALLAERVEPQKDRKMQWLITRLVIILG